MDANRDFHEGVTEFTTELYDKIIGKQGDTPENFIFSPLSIYTASLLIMAGADGETLRELQRLLRIPDGLPSGDVHNAFGPMILNYFKESAEMDLALANRLFLLRPIEILPDYTKQVGACYKSSVELIDALQDPETQRHHMNAWVSNITKDKIKELLPCGSVDNTTVLVIINALYFRGFWEESFNKLETCETDFYCLNGEIMKVQMMFKKTRFPVASFKELDCMGIRLPFQSSGWDMLILLPNERTGLSKLLSQLRVPGQISTVLNETFVEREVRLSLPKFKFTEGEHLDVKEVFGKCGVKQLFGASANLSKLSKFNLPVSDALHKAILEVDEEGVTAAAATYFRVKKCASLNAVKMRVEHPFVVALICDSKLPVFIGHVVKPEYK